VCGWLVLFGFVYLFIYHFCQHCPRSALKTLLSEVSIYSIWYLITSRTSAQNSSRTHSSNCTFLAVGAAAWMWKILVDWGSLQTMFCTRNALVPGNHIEQGALYHRHFSFCVFCQYCIFPYKLRLYELCCSKITCIIFWSTFLISFCKNSHYLLSRYWFFGRHLFWHAFTDSSISHLPFQPLKPQWLF